MQPKISIGVTVCNEHLELETLLDYLSDRALAPHYEIVVQIDKDNYTDEVIGTIVGRGVKHWFYPLNKDFASYKNELAKHCSGEYIFYIDADEIPSEYLIDNLPTILESNPEIDMFLVPRINTVKGITEEHILKWGWKYENERVNWPDYQTRIVKKCPSIIWKGNVHEKLDGYKTFSTLPPQDQFCLIHPKTIDRQEKQNQFYNTI